MVSSYHVLCIFLWENAWGTNVFQKNQSFKHSFLPYTHGLSQQGVKAPLRTPKDFGDEILKMSISSI